MPTLADIQAMTPQQAQTAFTEAQVLEIIYEDVRIDASLPIEQDEWGNAIKHVQKTVDAYGKLVGEKVIRWTYYDAEKGVVNEIIIEDAKEVATIKHTLDGKQPTIKRVAVAQAISEPIKRSRR